LADAPPTGIARWVREPFCGLSHAFGAVAAVLGLIALLTFAPDRAALKVSLAIYGVSMIGVFAASAAAHSLHASAGVIDWLDRLDRAAIFFFIAGTYTPICLSVLWGSYGVTILWIEWVLAIVGAAAVLHPRGPRQWLVLLYVPMGWLVVMAVPGLIGDGHGRGVMWLVLGGIAFTAGAVVFATQRPRLWPGRFGWHDLWHTMVLIGAACHFAAIWEFTIVARGKTLTSLINQML
jgi:hemolysin III